MTTPGLLPTKLQLMKAFILETVRNRGKRFIGNKIITFENFDFEGTWPRKYKLAFISETIRDRAKQSETEILTP